MSGSSTKVKGALVPVCFRGWREKPAATLSLCTHFLLLFRQSLTFEQGRVVRLVFAVTRHNGGQVVDQPKKAQRTSEVTASVIGQSKRVIVTTVDSEFQRIMME